MLLVIHKPNYAIKHIHNSTIPRGYASNDGFNVPGGKISTARRLTVGWPTIKRPPTNILVSLGGLEPPTFRLMVPEMRFKLIFSNFNAGE